MTTERPKELPYNCRERHPDPMRARVRCILFNRSPREAHVGPHWGQDAYGAFYEWPKEEDRGD